MAFIHCTRRNKDLLMHFKGKMTVENAAKIKKGLLKLYDQKASVYYADFSDIRDADITFFQLLIAFNSKLINIKAQLFILRNKIEGKLLNDLKFIGIEIDKHFLISKGYNDSKGK